MALPNTGITTYLVGNTLGTTSRNVSALCKHTNINKWAKGKPIPTFAPSLNLDEYEVGVNVDDKGEFVIAWVNEETLPKAIEIAKKYNKEYETGVDNYVKGNNQYVKIYITDEDWDQPYFDPNVKTLKDI